MQRPAAAARHAEQQPPRRLPGAAAAAAAALPVHCSVKRGQWQREGRGRHGSMGQWKVGAHTVRHVSVSNAGTTPRHHTLVLQGATETVQAAIQSAASLWLPPGAGDALFHQRTWQALVLSVLGMPTPVRAQHFRHVRCKELQICIGQPRQVSTCTLQQLWHCTNRQLRRCAAAARSVINWAGL